MRSRSLLLPLLVVSLAGCGGGGSNTDVSGGNYAQDLRFSNTGSTNATTTRVTSQVFGDAAFANQGAAGKRGTVTVAFGSTATLQRSLTVVVTDPTTDLVAEESFVVGGTGMASELTYSERSGTSVRTWTATGGTVDVIFRSNRQLALRLNDVRFQPVASTDATGTFTLNGKVWGEVD
ncbi:MAG TPA: hypothetical protein VGE01_06175 [Fimbriimonas sp.]